MKIDIKDGIVSITFGIDSIGCFNEIIGNAVSLDIMKGHMGLDACAVYHALNQIKNEHFVKSDTQKEAMIREITAFVDEQNDIARANIGLAKIDRPLAVNEN